MKKLIAMRINPETWKRLKIAAIKADITIGEYIAFLLDRHKEESEK